MSEQREVSFFSNKLVLGLLLGCALSCFLFFGNKYVTSEVDRCIDASKRSNAAYFGKTKGLLEQGFGRELKAR